MYLNPPRGSFGIEVFIRARQDSLLQVSIYPIWLCPFKLPAHPGMLKPHTNKVRLYSQMNTWWLYTLHLNGYIPTTNICILTFLSTLQHIPELICVFSRKRCLWMSESTEFRRTSGLTPRGQRGKSRSSSGDESHYNFLYNHCSPCNVLRGWNPLHIQT